MVSCYEIIQGPKIIIVNNMLLLYAAVWPGWGHASENPRLPNTLNSKGISVSYILKLYIAMKLIMSGTIVHRSIWRSDGGSRR
jgi:hypothetical protein